MAAGALAGSKVVLPFQAARKGGRSPQPCSVSSCSLSTSFARGGQSSLSKTAALMGSQMFGSGASCSGSGNATRRVTAMAQKVTGLIKLALPAGKANPAPPVGPALGAKGVNIMQFCKEYNAATQEKIGTIIPVEITVYEDRSFTFILKTPPASVLLKQAAGIETGSGQPNRTNVGSVSMDKIREIATIKLPDLNTDNVESAMRSIMGTAKNMGIAVTE